MKAIILSKNRIKEMNRLLAEWAGFESFASKSPISNFIIEYWCLKGHKEKGSFVLDFVNSLSNCYEWLVPKMKSCSLVSSQGDNHTVKIVLEDGSNAEFSSNSAPMSLCVALERLIIVR